MAPAAFLKRRDDLRKVAKLCLDEFTNNRGKKGWKVRVDAALSSGKKVKNQLPEADLAMVPNMQGAVTELARLIDTIADTKKEKLAALELELGC